MKVTVTAKTPVDIPELDNELVYRIVKNAILEVYGLEEGWFLRTGDWPEQAEVVTLEQHPENEKGHTTTMRTIRIASEQDVEGLRALERLREWAERKRQETEGNAPS